MKTPACGLGNQKETPSFTGHCPCAERDACPLCTQLRGTGLLKASVGGQTQRERRAQSGRPGQLIQLSKARMYLPPCLPGDPVTACGLFRFASPPQNPRSVTSFEMWWGWGQLNSRKTVIIVCTMVTQMNFQIHEKHTTEDTTCHTGLSFLQELLLSSACVWTTNLVQTITARDRTNPQPS